MTQLILALVPFETASHYGKTSWFSLRVCHRSPNRESGQQTPGEQQVWLEVDRFFPFTEASFRLAICSA
jgi:hypothetical protein